MLERLQELFVGKRVLISHTNRWMSNFEGLCVAVHKTTGDTNHFDLELSSGMRIGFNPAVVTPNSVDGELSGFAAGRRMIRVVPSQ